MTFMSQQLSRRSVLRNFFALFSTVCISKQVTAEIPESASCSPATSALVGAIRWDAWYDSASKVGKAVERTLTPKRYHFRLPFFSEVNDDIIIDGDYTNIISDELKFAEMAGLSFWAFDAYPPGDGMSNALHLYLTNSRNSKIKFCMLSGIDVFAHANIIEWHLSLMQDQRYQRLESGRPLYFLGFYKQNFVNRLWGGMDGLRAVIDRFRQNALSAGANTPYIVWLGTHYGAEVARDVEIARTLGCDALSAYAVNRNLRAAPYSELVHEAQDLWAAQAASGMPVVPIITTGFDRRPRIEHPVPWEHHSGAPTPGDMQIYYETATPPEIERAIKDCIAWMDANPKATPARAALVYAWNENDEGGWLIPTYPDNRERIKAAREALCID